MKRNPWRRIATTVSAMLAVLLLAAGWRFLESRGVFTSVEEKTSGLCRAVSGIAAVVDMAPTPSGAIAVASHDGLYLYRAGKLERVSGLSKNIHPAAITAAADKLQVLFRQDDHWTISVFAPKAPANAVAQVEELGRLTTDVLTDPADLVSVDGVRFYLINRHGTHTGLGRWLDDAFLLPRANVLYFDGMKFVTVAERLNSPAGIALSADNTRLYVSEDYPRTLVSFARNEFTGATDNPSVLSIASGLGKINTAKDGSLIIAARPKPGMGQVWRVKGDAAELLYARKNGEITAAAQMDRHLLIGGPDGLTDCAL